MTYKLHICVRPTLEQIQDFCKLGIDLSNETPMDITAFDVISDNPHFRQIFDLAQKCKYFSFLLMDPVYTEEELRQAEYFEIGSIGYIGYPEPSGTRIGYRKKTFDISGGCLECGIGYKQNNPFRFKKEPKLSKRTIFSLNWVYGDFFVKKSVWKTYLAPLGIDCIPAVLHKSGEILENIVQLKIEETCELEEMDDCTFETCPKCGRTKYHRWDFKGIHPYPKNKVNLIAKSVPYFGSGGSANHSVIISRKLYDVFQSIPMHGIRYRICRHNWMDGRKQFERLVSAG
jgi:hypothetical protein